MGKVIAQDLSKNYETKIADINKDVCDIPIDILNQPLSELKAVFKPFDLIVGALPSKLGFKPARIAAELGINYIDLSFSKESPSQLHEEAKKTESIIFYDCGLSPGLSNLIAGRFNQISQPTEVCIMVGGISQDKEAPYGHVNTWCPEDLKEEYIRPARFIENWQIQQRDPLSEKDWIWIDFEPIGRLQGFLSDGLRSLLDLKGPQTIKEYTIRRPNHLSEVKKLIESNQFVQEIKEKCNKGKDVVLLQVECDQMCAKLHHEAQEGLSAMARTTAYSCALFARLQLEEIWDKPGSYSPEQIGQSKIHFDYIVSKLKEKNICIEIQSK